MPKLVTFSRTLLEVTKSEEEKRNHRLLFEEFAREGKERN